MRLSILIFRCVVHLSVVYDMTTFWVKILSCASPCLQGHNQLVAYSRAAYFCIFCALIWLLEQLLRIKDLPVSTLYGVTIVCHDALHFTRDLLVGRQRCTCAALELPFWNKLSLTDDNQRLLCWMHPTGFTYCFPISFLVGLFPQINTFTIYLLEQIDIHFFGGTGES